jgi:BMFP domain-containing protein YqiC
LAKPIKASPTLSVDTGLPLDVRQCLRPVYQEISLATFPQQLLADAQIRLGELLRASPAADLERNLKALLAQTFQKLELVTREEFEIERTRLGRLQARLDALERDLGAARTERPAAAQSVRGAAGAPHTPADVSLPANPYQLPPSA